MTKEEVAKYLNVTERTVLDWAQKDSIPAFKIGGSWRFRHADIIKWLESQRTGPAVTSMPPQVEPAGFSAIGRETNIRACIEDIEFRLQDSTEHFWLTRDLLRNHGEVITNEAISRLVAARKITTGFEKIFEENIAVIRRRTT
jgi:excisionase family DNA binding protein